MIQPYQIFFPLGLFYGLWGVILWPFFALGWVEYPGQAHAGLMMGGFLLNFATGFLLTAVPRFSGAPPAKRGELLLALVLNLWPIALFLSWTSDDKVAASACGMILVFLAWFFSSRMRKRSFSPPPFFPLVGLGLVMGITGATGMIFQGYGIWRSLLFQGTMLCMIMGIGERLIAALLGWSRSPMVQIELPSASGPKRYLPVGLVMVATAGGFLVEGLGWVVPGRVIRVLALSWIAVTRWQLMSLPKIKGTLPTWLWLSVWGLVLGFWVHAVFPSTGIHGLHLAYVSGFGLMTLMVATRVTLAHGGYGLELEYRSKSIWVTGVLLLLAAVTRLSAGFLGASYFPHLAYAGVLWVVALLVWGAVFLPKVWHVR